MASALIATGPGARHAQLPRRGGTPQANTVATTVVIADDHGVVRAGLRLLLDAAEGIKVIAEAADVPSAIETITTTRPTVAVLDLYMPGGSGLEAIITLARAVPETAIVVLTMQDDPAFARQALRNGARGFVLKEAADEELLQAIRLAASGRSFLSPRVGAHLAAQPPPKRPRDDAPS